MISISSSSSFQHNQSFYSNTIELHSTPSRSTKLLLITIAYLSCGATFITLLFSGFLFGLFFAALGALGAVYLAIKILSRSKFFEKRRYAVFDALLLVVGGLLIFVVIPSLLTQSIDFLFMFDIVFLLSASFMSFLTIALLLWATYSTQYSLDLQTNELVIKKYSTILKFLVERRIHEKDLKSGKIVHKDYGEDETLGFVLKTFEKEKISISSTWSIINNDLNTSHNILAFSALSLMKYFQIPITLKGNRFPEEKRDKMFSSKIFEELRDYASIWQEIPSLETTLLRLGWKKVKDNPVTLQQHSEIGWSYIFGICMYIPTLLFFLGVLFWDAIERQVSFLDFSLGLLFISPIIFFLFIVPAASLPLIKRNLFLKIDEQGVQTGFKYLGLSVSNILWPYPFIQGLEIVKDGIIRQFYYVTLDVFLSSVKIAKFKSKEKAERFQKYVEHLCHNYQKRGKISKYLA